MEIRENDKICILTPLNPKLDSYQSKRLSKEIMSETRDIAIDLSYTQDCTYEFIETIKEICKKKVLGFINIPSDMFTLFNIMDIDKTAKLFVTEEDFITNSRRLINRKFSII